MKIKFLLASLACMAMSLNAAIVKNPDSNTLWMENGENMRFSPKSYSRDWLNTSGKVVPEKNGFTLEPKTGNKGMTGIYVPVSREYPYLEFDLDYVEQEHGFVFQTDVVNIGPRYTVGKGMPAGRYFFNVFENTEKMPKKAGAVFFAFRITNGKVRISNLKMVKTPSVPLIVKSEQMTKEKFISYGTELQFSVPENSANLHFYNALNGKEIILNDLRSPEVKKNPLTVKVSSFFPKKLYAGQTLIKIRSSGKTAFTWLPYAWEPEKRADLQNPFAGKYSWIPNLRTDHPRIFINKDTLPKLKEWVKKIGYQQIIADADNFKIDPNLKVKKRGALGNKRPYPTREVTVGYLHEPEALTCALAYLLTDDKKYLEKAWTFLDHNLAVYQECAAKRTSVSWFAIGRIETMAALDWIWNGSDPARRKKYLKDFIDVNIKYARHGWHGPFSGVNGGSGKASGFYGDANNELFMGILAYKEGVYDELAIDLLKKGYDKYEDCLEYRENVAQDDGILVTAAMGYSGGQYPWASYDFLYLWRSAFKKPVQLPRLNHLLYYGEWYQWNMLPGKDKVKIREFGMGDNAKTNMNMWPISGHLYAILGVYGNVFPAESEQVANVIARMDGTFDPEWYKENEIVKRNIAPKYYSGFFRRYLAYGIENLKKRSIPKGDAGSDTVMARHFPVGGLLFMRSGMKDDSTRAVFNIGSTLVAHKTRGDENHFTIFRKGYLAIDSGYRYDSWYAPVKYHRSSVAHNTMLIHDPDEKFLNDEKECRANFKKNYHAWNDTPEQDKLFKMHEPFLADAQGSQDKPLGGKCRAFSTNRFYTYIVGDAAKAYSDKKCKEFTRQFIHVQPDTFIVFDRVESVKPEFKKEWLLHFLEEPVVKGNLTTAKVSDEGGVIRCYSLLPAGGKIEKIGGPGKEFYGTRVNWTVPKKFLDKVNYGGSWRIALSPEKPAKRDYFLNVIDVGEQTVKDIRCKEDEKTASVTFTTPQGRTVRAVFNKLGGPGGKITVSENGKKLCNEEFTRKVQPQKGFLY